MQRDHAALARERLMQGRDVGEADQPPGRGSTQAGPVKTIEDPVAAEAARPAQTARTSGSSHASVSNSARIASGPASQGTSPSG